MRKTKKRAPGETKAYLEQKRERFKEKLKTLNTSELLAKLQYLSVVRGTAGTRANVAKTKWERRNHFMAFALAKIQAEAVCTELEVRMGTEAGQVSRMVMWNTKLSRERQTVKCMKCGFTGGRLRLHLDWFDEEGRSLRQIVKTGNPLPADHVLKDALATWTVYCRQCAQHMGYVPKPQRRKPHGSCPDVRLSTDGDDVETQQAEAPSAPTPIGGFDSVDAPEGEQG